MERKCRFVPLSKQPLVLVLGQVRFSPIRRMEAYVADIQEEFRRHGFPVERSGKVQQVVFGPGGGVPVQVVEQQRWEYRTKDESWSVLIMEDAVVLQTTSYERFEVFADRLLNAVRTVFRKTEHDRLGVVERVGLRYVDVIQAGNGENFRDYLRPGFHGVTGGVFEGDNDRFFAEHTAKTTVGKIDGTMLVRVIQNDEGFLLPPDLLAGAPRLEVKANPGELITLVDMDHYIEGSFDPDAKWVVSRAYEMHDELIETFHEHVVTQRAIEVWK